MGCMICDRIDLTKRGENPFLVRELETGYVVIGDHQHFRGYSLFLCKEHATELHFLPQPFRGKHLEELALVYEAVYRAFQPDKMNCELAWHGGGRRSHTLAPLSPAGRRHRPQGACLAHALRGDVRGG